MSKHCQNLINFILFEVAIYRFVVEVLMNNAQEK